MVYKTHITQFILCPAPPLGIVLMRFTESLWEVIIHPCPDSIYTASALTKPWLTLGHGWVITFKRKLKDILLSLANDQIPRGLSDLELLSVNGLTGIRVWIRNTYIL